MYSLHRNKKALAASIAAVLCMASVGVFAATEHVECVVLMSRVKK